MLRRAGLPQRSRFVIGTGFGLTEPEAVEELDEKGAAVRIVIGSQLLDVGASAFHPKLYLVRRNDELIVFSGSANLTGGGLQNNVEQYEELRVPLGSPVAATHAQRFASLFDLGHRLSELRESGAWEAYRSFANLRRAREKSDAAEERRIAALMRDLIERNRDAARALAPAETAAHAMPTSRRSTPSGITTHRVLTCSVCGKRKPETEFPTRHLKTGVVRGEECRECRDKRLNAYDLLLDDLHQLWHRCGAEVKLPNKHGVLKAYWPRRYRQYLRYAEADGQQAVIAYVNARVTAKTAATGFNNLMGVGRPRLTLEWLVADASKPYHHMFDAETVAIARERLGS
jgi:hypothetical protein